jgi:hypothetical protein
MLADNPLGTDGFEFVEFTVPQPDRAQRAVRADGLYRRGAHRCTAPRPTPWPSGSRTPAKALKLAVERGATPVQGRSGRWS